MAMDGGSRGGLERWLEPFLVALGHLARMRMRPVYVAGLIGTILSPAADRLSADADGCLRLDVRIMAELDDGALV
jgi:hypothetical protein